MIDTLNKNQSVPNEYLRIFDTIQNSTDKYITKSKILNLMGYEYNSSNERWLRNAISKLIDDYSYPIGCSYKNMNVVITSLLPMKKSSKQWKVLKD